MRTVGGTLVTGRRTNHEAVVARPGAPVHVMHVVYALQPGGMELGVVKVVNGLDRARVRSSICSTVPATRSVRELVAADVPVFELQRRPGNDPRLVADLYRLFRQERPEVVHTHAWGTLMEGLLAARLARVPVVVHGEHGTLQLKPYQARLQRLMWSRVDRLLSVSSRLAERMAATTGFPVERIHVIRNGVDLTRFQSVDRAEARRLLGVPAEGLAIGTAGRLVPVKDHANLLRALGQLGAQGVELTAVIAGEGPLRAELESQAAALGLAPRLRFLGHQAAIERVYAALDVFVLPSRSEGLSNTTLEAMASGLPVVATRVGGADELVEDGVSGLLVPPGDPAALARALARFASDFTLRQAAGVAGRQRALTQYGLEHMVRRYGELYCQLAARAGTRAPLIERMA